MIEGAHRVRDTVTLPMVSFRTHRTHRAVAGLTPPIISLLRRPWPLPSANYLTRDAWFLRNVFWFLHLASPGSPSCVAMAATAVRAAAAVVLEVFVEYPGVRWRGNVVAAASNITSAFARMLHTAFACKGSGCGGGSGGGRIIFRQDSCLAATAFTIGAP